MAYISSPNLGAIYSHVHSFIHLSSGSGFIKLGRNHHNVNAD